MRPEGGTEPGHAADPSASQDAVWSQDSRAASLQHLFRKGSACPINPSKLPAASSALVMLVRAFTGQGLEVAARRFAWGFTIAMPIFFVVSRVP